MKQPGEFGQEADSFLKSTVQTLNRGGSGLLKQSLSAGNRGDPLMSVSFS